MVLVSSLDCCGPSRSFSKRAVCRDDICIGEADVDTLDGQDGDDILVGGTGDGSDDGDTFIDPDEVDEFIPIDDSFVPNVA